MAVARFFINLSIGILGCTGLWAQQFTISTVAGNGSQGFAGDGGSAKTSQLAFPGHLAIDSSGKLYIADAGNHRIRVITNGSISTVAGNGTAGYAGDGSSATGAELNNPTGIAVDSSGNLYIADSVNNVVRKVSSGGISTIAGNNKSGAGYSGDGGAATSARLNDPVAVAVDSSGNVFIADANNNVIREVSSSNISTIVGGAATSLQLSHPDGLVVDAAGALYIADTDDRRIVKYAAGTVTVIAGNGGDGFSGDGGPAVDATLWDPFGLAVDAGGNIYIADTFNNRVRIVSPGGTITTIAGNGLDSYFGDGGPAIDAGLYFPHGVAVDTHGNVYVADTYNHTVRLLQIAPPAIFPKGVVSAASFTAPVSPGAIASIFGTNLASGTAYAGLPLPTSLGDVSVSVDGKAAPLLYVSPSQVNFQVPWETATGTATISVNNGNTSNSVTVAVLAAAPGLFLYDSGRAVVQNSDTTLNSPTNPAKEASTITAYLTGCGPVNPPVADGVASPSNPPANLTLPASATIGSATAKVSFAGMAPGFAGLVQLNIVVPSGLAAGDYPLKVSVGGQTSNSGVISVKP